MTMTGPDGSRPSPPAPSTPRRIGFVSTRFAGTDGVSLETAKWVSVLERLGHTCYYFAGVLDRPPERSRGAAEAFYRHPEIEAINRRAYGGDWASDNGWAPEAAPDPARTGGVALSIYTRPPALTRRIHELRESLKAELHAFVAEFDLELLVIENASAIPLNLPLGLAIAELVAEVGIPTIAHHHDFHWERQRFLVNCVPDILAAAFPPSHPSIRHVVINSVQAMQLASRHGLTARVIPNVMEFEHPPLPPDVDPAVVRADLGIAPGELFLLQPTRVIQRKGIEQAIEFTRRLGRPAKLVISHASGDEGPEYETRVREFAALLGVDVRFESEIVADVPGTTADGRRIYTLAEVYPAADFVTYPSTFEGFGNAFLEAVYFRRPILVNNYSTYEVDIRPRGFRVVWFDGFISDATMTLARRLLDDPGLQADWGARNYELGARHFSFAILRRHLEDLLADCFGEVV
ncbi:MAG TPA: glycosyltransferase family 4 protein [Candidatus Limnocylindrales bacterium]|nr:glycosyltransferase family 4 protein [Candidatus Limnocylindrales bacterium]